MTREEAIHKLEYSKKAYQTLIDEKVDSGKLVGDGVRGEWKAETSLDEAYKSMIEALDMALELLEKEPCEDCISREAVDEYITKLLSGYLYDEERTRLEELTAYIWELPSVRPTRPTGKWIDIGNEGLVFKCSLCGLKKTIESHYCPNCGARMAESEEEA